MAMSTGARQTSRSAAWRRCEMTKASKRKAGSRPGEDTVFKVRLARTFASYWFITAKDQDEAERKAFEKMSDRDFDAESEASHIHDSVEVEEAI